ncbi:MAG: cytochrome c biogenesis protein CcsA [Prevotella sp.]
MKKTIYVIYLMIVAVLAAATIIGEREGIDYARQAVYGSWWFMAAWAALVVAGMAYMARRRPRSMTVMALHCALVVILLGAFVTHKEGIQGTIHLRKGSFAVFYQAEGQERRLPFAIRLDDFSVQLYCENGNVADYISDITIADTDHNVLKEGSVSMNNILRYEGWRFYQWSYDDDGMGVSLVINHDPWGIAITYVGYLLLFLSAVAVTVSACRRLAKRRREEGRLSGFERGILATSITLSALVVVAGAYFFVTQLCGRNPWIPDMQPILNSPWLSVHVSIITISYVLLLLALVCSVAGLCRRDAGSLRLVSLMLLYPAVSALAIGIFIGAIWANVSWGTYWSWDPKEVWALITMMVYATALHGKCLPWLRRPRVFHAFMAVSFLTILMTFFGVNYLLSGLHSYV